MGHTYPETRIISPLTLFKIGFQETIFQTGSAIQITLVFQLC